MVAVTSIKPRLPAPILFKLVRARPPMESTYML